MIRIRYGLLTQMSPRRFRARLVVLLQDIDRAAIRAGGLALLVQLQEHARVGIPLAGAG